MVYEPLVCNLGLNRDVAAAVVLHRSAVASRSGTHCSDLFKLAWMPLTAYPRYSTGGGDYLRRS